MKRETLADLLKGRRETLGLNQSQLARRLGIQQQQVSKWERAVTLPDSVRLPALADALEMDVADLYAAHASAAEAEMRNTRKELSETLQTVERFVDQYRELGHTYRRIDDAVSRLLDVCEQIAAQQGEMLTLLRRRGKG